MYLPQNYYEYSSPFFDEYESLLNDSLGDKNYGRSLAYKHILAFYLVQLKGRIKDETIIDLTRFCEKEAYSNEAFSVMLFQNINSIINRVGIGDVVVMKDSLPHKYRQYNTKLSNRELNKYDGKAFIESVFNEESQEQLFKEYISGDTAKYPMVSQK